MKKLSCLVFPGVFSAVLLAACASAGAGICDPITIHVNGKCYWDQPSACDAANCNAPNRCTVVEDKPARVECERVDEQPAK